jgi:hypothetical protein
MATQWIKAVQPGGYADTAYYTAVYYTASESSCPAIKGIPVSIHRTPDRRTFVGARHSRHEHAFPPRFQPSLKAAMVYVELMKD